MEMRIQYTTSMYKEISWYGTLTFCYLYIRTPFSCKKLLALNTPTIFDVHQFCVVLTSLMQMRLVCLSHATGIGLTLNNVQYTKNSVVTITDIGTGSAALLCTTTFIPCCFSGPPPGTNWYFLNPLNAEVILFMTVY